MRSRARVMEIPNPHRNCARCATKICRAAPHRDRRLVRATWTTEDLIEREDMVVTITSGGYIKRTPLADFRAQRRGGKGLSGMATKDDDVVTKTLFVANTQYAAFVLHHPTGLV